jgi:hypothetical protein
MGKFGKELIESMQQAARHAAGKKGRGLRKQRRHSFATAELSDVRVQAIGASCMDERHTPLDAMLKRK